MKNFTLLVLCLIGLTFFSCQKETQPTTTLKVNLAGTGPENLEIFNIAQDLHFNISEQKDSINLDLKEEVILNLKKYRDVDYVYLKPGDKLSVDTSAKGEVLLGINATNKSKENDALIEFATIMKVQGEEFFLPEIGKKEVDSFLLLVNKKFAPLEKLVTDIATTEGISQGFKDALNVRLLANKGNDLLTYKNIYNYYNKKEPELPNDFYAEIEKIDFTNPNLLTFDEGRRFGKTWATKDLNFQDYESVPAFYKASLKKIQKDFPNSLLRDYCYYDAVFSNVNFGGGIDESAAMIDDFKATVTNKYLNAKLDETIEPWLDLKAGAAAPDFTVKNRIDGEVKLSSLQGKKVYIDVWATWCGPCIREIPALKELEKEMHEENIEFVSVSIDQEKDKEKWLNFIKEKELGGLQLMAQDDWKSDVATAYNIKGIPRFLLIDEGGKIISANAPRPSAPNIKEVLMN